MKYRITPPRGRMAGTVHLPTSKSISNRLLVMRALSGNRVEILDLSESEDTKCMQKAFSAGTHIIDVGHAGTAMRFLAAYLSNREGDRVLTGSERMQNRPIGKLVDALRQLGADITYLGKEGYPPLGIRGKKLAGGNVTIDGSTSSQFISAILMIAPSLPGGLQLTIQNELISAPYVRLTLELMKKLGIEYHWKDNLISITPQEYRKGTITVEPDWSAASYWYELAALADDAEILISGLRPGSLQGDAAIERWFDVLGVKTEYTPEGAVIRNACSAMNFLELDFTGSPDMVQTFAVVCTLLDVSFRFTGTQSLRIKETDRIAALQTELEKFGAKLEYKDGGLLSWEGPLKEFPRGGIDISTYNDHRMALAFAPAVMKTGELVIQDPTVVVKSYPGFWDELKNLGFDIAVVEE